MIGLLIALAIVGFLTWLIVTYIPMPPAIKNLIVVVVVVIILIYLLQLFGLFTLGPPVPRLHR